MSSGTASNRPRSWWARLVSVLPVIAIILAAAALLLAWQAEQRPPIVVSDEVSPDLATAVLDRASDAVNFAESILSFLEGASVVLGLIVAVGAWMLRGSVQDQIATLRDELNETKAEFTRRQDDVERRVESRQSALETQFADTRKEVTGRQDRVEERVENRQIALDTRLTEYTSAINQQFADREVTLNRLQTEVQTQLTQVLANTQKQIEDARTRADRSFRLLNNLVLAEQQVRAHNHASALNILRDALKDEPDNYAVNYLLGYLYSLRKEFDLAIQHLEKSLAQEAGFAPAIAALGLALRRKGDSLEGDEFRTERSKFWAEAETRLLKALEIDPHLTDAEGESYYGSLGGLYKRRENYENAMEQYQKAMDVTPTSSYPLINLASLYWHEGDFDEARAYFQRVHDAARLKLDVNPLDNWARADYAQSLVALGRQEEAMQQIQLVRENHPELGLLTTIRDGLTFMAEAPKPIDGMDDLLAAIDDALDE